MIWKLGEELQILETDAQEKITEAIFVGSGNEGRKLLHMAGMNYDGGLSLETVRFCKMEIHQECLVGTFSIPKLKETLGEDYQLYFFVNQSNIVILDDTDFSERMIAKIRDEKNNQGSTKERFIYNFITEFLTMDAENLVAYEEQLLSLEERITSGQIEGVQEELTPLRRQLLVLREYYDEMVDVGAELEEDENAFFAHKELKYLGVITDRAGRLLRRTEHLLEYAQQLKEAHQSHIDAKQNNNMQFLTVVSTIFFPLTLITGWYGMNFHNMPELRNGYPGVIGLSLVIIGVCVYIFKKKGMF